MIPPIWFAANVYTSKTMAAASSKTGMPHKNQYPSSPTFVMAKYRSKVSGHRSQKKNRIKKTVA